MPRIARTNAIEDAEAELQLAATATEAALVDAARRGDSDSFGELVQRYESRLQGVLSQFVRDGELVRDLAQESFLRAFERLDQFDPSRRFGPWLFRIGVNIALDHLRKKRRRIWSLLFSDAPEASTPDPATPDPRTKLDFEQEVRYVLSQIPERYRTVLILRDLENFSSSDIAAITNRKEATIRWRLAEARLRFQKLWMRRQSPGREIPPALNETDDNDVEE
jgi:RNA polymerase sigma-70 factor (ECF subfamily)